MFIRVELEIRTGTVFELYVTKILQTKSYLHILYISVFPHSNGDNCSTHVFLQTIHTSFKSLFLLAHCQCAKALK